MIMKENGYSDEEILALHILEYYLHVPQSHFLLI